MLDQDLNRARLTAVVLHPEATVRRSIAPAAP
jgi:hypothetical protein